jgi:hypothetical protein
MTTKPTFERQDRLGAGAYVLGGLSFIPMLGVIPGVISIIWGLSSRKAGGRTLALIGGAGVLFTVALYAGLFYFGFVQRGGIYDELRVRLAQTVIDDLVPRIETYKIQNGRYPDSLDALKESLPPNSVAVIYDPTDVRAAKPRAFYYERVGEDHYYLRGVGADGVPFTPDDIVPEVGGAQPGKLGLLRERQPSP